VPFYLVPVHDYELSGWWLTGEDLNDRIGELQAGPDAVHEAQHWAADQLGRIRFPVAGWRPERFENGRAYYVAELVGEPGDGEPGDGEPGDGPVDSAESNDVAEADDEQAETPATDADQAESLGTDADQADGEQ
jgi:hypothetical protein